MALTLTLNCNPTSKPNPSPDPNPNPNPNQVKNSAFKKAEHYRLMCNGESWRETQKKKKVAKKKWAKAIDEPPLTPSLTLTPTPNTDPDLSY